MKKQILKIYVLCVICFCTAQLFAQNGSVTGKVTDKETGEALIGATVSVKGAKVSTLTDVNGRFVLQNVPNVNNATLTVSYLGYRSATIAVSGNTSVNISLQADVSSLNEVVVIGYGTTKRSDLTGAVSSVSGKDIAAVPVPNAAQALAGKLPGVNVVTQDGRPDASISIRVRGGGSISQSNDPLYIVDGFPVGSISDIPASQIESIDVLKDASSTAIYGARGANGVIIVTTKGAKEGKLSITYDGYGKFNTPAKYFDTMNAYDYIAYNWGYAKAISDSYADTWARLWGIGSFASTYNNTAGIDHYRSVGATSFAKQAYNDSFSQSHNVNLSSGTEKTRFLLAFNHVDEDGMKVNSFYKRSNVSLKLDQTLTSTLKFSLDTRYTDVNSVSNEGTTNGKGSILSSAYAFRPIATADVLGELDPNVNTQLGFYDNVLQDDYNPVALMKDYIPENRNRALRANTALDWTIIKGLVARTDLGLNTNWNINRTWSGAVYNHYFDSDGNKTFGGNASISNNQGWNMRWSNTLNYDVQGLGKKHSLNVLAGQEVSNSGSQGTKIFGNYYPASFDKDRAFAIMDQYLASTTTVNSGLSSSSGTPNRLLSFFGRANYSFASKYLFTATFRADGSSRFAPAKRWGYFPAGAVAWRASEEDFLKSVDWLDNLKVRFSYGAVGNDGISANLWNFNWKSSGLTGYSINETQQPAYVPGSDEMPNPSLKWETTITRNLGFDFGIFRNKLYGSIELYKNSTKDLLMRTPASPYSGFQYTYENVGSTSNKGIEIGLASDLINKENFNLNLGLNLNINRGKIEELAEGVTGLYKSQWGSTMTQPNTGDYIFQEGSPVGLVRGYTYDGWYTVDDFDYVGGKYVLKTGVPDISSGIIGTVYGTNANKPGGQVAYPGVIKFKDLSGPAGAPDGKVDENDVEVIGNMNPKYTGGLNLSGNYKDFDFRMDFNWSVGNKIYNAEYLAAFYGSKEDGLYKNRLNYLSSSYRIYDIQGGQITPVTDPAALKALNANATTFLPYHENPVVSTLGIQDGSYLRLNTVTLGYKLPKTLSSKVGLSTFRIYGSVYNALLFTNYKGMDPDVNTNTSQGGAQYPTTGLDWGAYPRARSFVIGLNAQF
ncbi:SusC/RagA family TonB-linked outer membrane protein [Pelobium manganitolerans]|uniref:SusC/RagA family TonB-linked outer membrane protein n=1 Tax=Pelobium manganitolerans TaxID=1842495 RepID=A0A419S726_9SPHI|nr:TonB-dependent receptor [Pelobium manganitolerans]RKD17152.1 SusC/RagA family TonB-linked outer membrane protein [Pelobium manganitolerans]